MEPDEDEYEHDEIEEYVKPGRRMTKLDLLISAVAFTQLVAEAAAMTLDHVVALMAGHANAQVADRKFADKIRMDLESIPTTDER